MVASILDPVIEEPRKDAIIPGVPVRQAVHTGSEPGPGERRQDDSCFGSVERPH